MMYLEQNPGHVVAAALYLADACRVQVLKWCLWCRAVGKRSGQADIVVKQIECDSPDDEIRIRREAETMHAVRSLDGCLPGLGTYAGLSDPRSGRAVYYLTMP